MWRGELVGLRWQKSWKLAVECLGKTGQLFGFHEHPNPACPIGNNIHGVLDGKLEEIQLAMEKEMAQISLEQVVKEAKMKMEVAS